MRGDVRLDTHAIEAFYPGDVKVNRPTHKSDLCAGDVKLTRPAHKSDSIAAMTGSIPTRIEAFLCAGDVRFDYPRA